jgi:hypothetical protein
MPDPVFDDGSTIEVYCPVESPGTDHSDLVATEEDIAAGDFLGSAIDPDDDNDNGEQWGTVDDPTMTGADFAELEGWTPEGPPS